MISVLTCPRPGGISYLEPLIEAISRACPFERRVLICDGPTKLFDGWETITHPAFPKPCIVDNKYPGWIAIEQAALTCEDLLFLEDDARPAYPGAIEDAVAYRVPDACGFSSLHVNRWTQVGTHPAYMFTLSQAVKFPRRSLAAMLEWRRVSWGDFDAVNGIDTAFASCGRANKWSYEQTEKNYFDHVGLVSAVRNNASGTSVAL